MTVQSKEVTVLSEGDATDVNTWSNVPYFLTKAFEDCGYTVNRVNVLENTQSIERFFNRTITRLIRIFMPKTTYCFRRSFLCSIMMDKIMKDVADRYPNSEFFVSLSFSWNPSKYTDKKCIMMCDWTYQFDIEYDKKKKIDRLEMHEINRQKRVLESAYSNVIFRTQCRQWVQENLPNVFVYNKGMSVINCGEELQSFENAVSTKIDSNTVVFLGAKRYLSGAKALIHAINELVMDGINIECFYIGITPNDVAEDVEIGTNNHLVGYLNKGIQQDKVLYYSLLRKAKVCINTNEDFISLAAMKEASYFYNPVIISRHIQSETIYGLQDFGGYYSNNDVDSIKRNLLRIFELPAYEYKHMCLLAHEHFKDDSWKSTINQFIQIDFGHSI